MHKLALLDTIRGLTVHVVEQFVDVFHGCLDVHGLNCLNKVFFCDRWVLQALLRCEDVEDLLKGELVGLLDLLNLGAGRSKDRVDEALLKEGDVDALACHKVNEVLVCDLKFVVVCKTHILDDPFCLLLVQVDSKLLQTLLDTVFSDVLIRQHVLEGWVAATVGQRLRVEDVVQRHVLVLKRALNLFVDVVDLLPDKNVFSFEVFRGLLHHVVADATEGS